MKRGVLIVSQVYKRFDAMEKSQVDIHHHFSFEGREDGITARPVMAFLPLALHAVWLVRCGARGFRYQTFLPV